MVAVIALSVQEAKYVIECFGLSPNTAIITKAEQMGGLYEAHIIFAGRYKQLKDIDRIELAAKECSCSKCNLVLRSS